MNEQSPCACESKSDILIVDDKPENLRLLSGILKEQGYAVRTLRKSLMVSASVDKFPPDIILLDIMMPDMDGYEVCMQLKANERTRDIPVVFISALNESADKVKAFSVGGVDYITKPFQEEEVLSRVQTHLSIHSLQKQLEMQNNKNQAIISAMPDMIFIQNQDGVFFDFHIKDRGDLYVSPDNFMGKKITDIMPRDVAEKNLQSIARAYRTKEMVIYEYSLPIRDECRYFEARSVPYGDDQILTIVRNVTEAKKKRKNFSRRKTGLKQPAGPKANFWRICPMRSAPP